MTATGPAPFDMRSLEAALSKARVGKNEVHKVLLSVRFSPRLPGLTKLISGFGKEGSLQKALEIFDEIPNMGIQYDCAIVNAALSACSRGKDWQTALAIFTTMPELNLEPDAITFSSVISALAKGKQWLAALEVFGEMETHAVNPDVVTCCSLITAFEIGGRWSLSLQLLLQMCSGSGPLCETAKTLSQESFVIKEELSPCLSSLGSETASNEELQSSLWEHASARFLMKADPSPRLPNSSSSSITSSQEKPHEKTTPSTKAGSRPGVKSQRSFGHDSPRRSFCSSESSATTLSPDQGTAFPYSNSAEDSGLTNGIATPRDISLASALLRRVNVGDIEPNRVCCNAVLAALSRAKPSQWRLALTLLGGMATAGRNLLPDIVSYNTAIKACANGGELQRALKVFCTMTEQKIRPNITTFTILLTAGTELKDWNAVNQLWGWLKSSGLEPSAACLNAYVLTLGNTEEETKLDIEEPSMRPSYAAAVAAGSHNPPGSSESSNHVKGVRIKYQGDEDNKHISIEAVLEHIAGEAERAKPEDMKAVASEGIAAFQHAYSFGRPLSSTAYASLLSILDSVNAWELAPQLYRLYPAQEVLDGEIASALIPNLLTSGQYFRAFHYWLLLSHQSRLPISLKAQQSLIVASQRRNAWQQASLILGVMLQSQILPDSSCSGIVLKMLVKAGALLEATGLVHELTAKGVALTATAAADVLAAVDAHIANADPRAFQLLQTLAVNATGTAERLKDVARALEASNLAGLSIHLLDTWPPEADFAAEVYWVFLEKLIIGHEAVAAIQLATHGHNSGALTHYTPFHLADKEQKMAFAHVNLETCCVESAIIILLSWACNLALAMEEGHQIRANRIGFIIGSCGSPARFQDILSTIRQVFARDVRADRHFLFADITLPSSTALQSYLADGLGQKGAIYLPTPLIQAWLWALKNTPTYILATQPI